MITVPTDVNPPHVRVDELTDDGRHAIPDGFDPVLHALATATWMWLRFVAVQQGRSHAGLPPWV